LGHRLKNRCDWPKKTNAFHATNNTKSNNTKGARLSPATALSFTGNENNIKNFLSRKIENRKQYQAYLSAVQHSPARVHAGLLFRTTWWRRPFQLSRYSRGVSSIGVISTILRIPFTTSFTMHFPSAPISYRILFRTKSAFSTTGKALWAQARDRGYCSF
jgi:hypothetical protein